MALRALGCPEACNTWVGQVAARNCAKNTNRPCGVAAAPSSQRTCMRPPSASTTYVGVSLPAPARPASSLPLASLIG